MSIDWNRVIFTYPGNEKHAGSGFSLHVEQGETVLLLGPSGSGKSTLAHMLNGLIPHSIAGELDGSVSIDGRDIRELDPGELALTVGTVFQDPESQAVMMTIQDDIAFGMENVGIPAAEMDRRMQEGLSAAGLSIPLTTEVEGLSGGQKQRLALAGVLAMQPPILVLDEPTANLDPAGTSGIFRSLSRLKATGRYTMVLIEHKLDEVIGWVDRIVIIDSQGQVVGSGPPQQMLYDHCYELERLGIWLPSAVELAISLRREGVPFWGRPLTLEELADALRPLATGLRGCTGLEPTEAESESEGLAGSWSSRGIMQPAGQQTEAQASPPPLLDIRPVASLSRRESWLAPMELRLGRGELWAIAGENGAGKTTLARHLIGLLPVRPGVLFFDGRDQTQIPARELVRRIGYVFQNPEHQFVTERVADEIAFGLQGQGWPAEAIQTRVEQLLTRFHLSSYADAHPYRLSHGQKRRLSVAAMLAGGQELLILDEPTFGQDRRHTLELMAMMKELVREGTTILMITHDMRLIADYADGVAILSKGTLLKSGPVKQVFADRSLLAQAGLSLPPVAELSALLGRVSSEHGLEPEVSSEAWLRSWGKRAGTREQEL